DANIRSAAFTRIPPKFWAQGPRRQRLVTSQPPVLPANLSLVLHRVLSTGPPSEAYSREKPGCRTQSSYVGTRYATPLAAFRRTPRLPDSPSRQPGQLGRLQRS